MNLKNEILSKLDILAKKSETCALGVGEREIMLV